MVTKQGFSLIELIVVMGLISLLMLAISGIMLMSIVSSNRIRTTTNVKQAGNYALGQIQGLIRNAKQIVSCNTSNATIVIVNPDGESTTIQAIEVGLDTRISSNSGVYLTSDNLTVPTFSIECFPDTITPTLIKVSFELKNNSTTAINNPSLHFETSVSPRNQ